MHCVGLLLVADDGQGQRFLGNVDDGAPENVGDLDDLILIFAVLGADLIQHQLAANGMAGHQQLHGVDGDHLGQLVAHEVGLVFVGHHFDGHAGDLRVVGGADGQGLHVKALSGEQAGDLRQNAGLVVHQNGQSTQFHFFHVASSSQLTRNSVMWVPPLTMGRTSSPSSMVQSMT